uniref:Uncharacterized protein n=1 Tax=Sphaerodactylus townsendi TaxID=933632 RepID=A0ACB8FMB1_9SAUR
MNLTDPSWICGPSPLSSQCDSETMKLKVATHLAFTIYPGAQCWKESVISFSIHSLIIDAHVAGTKREEGKRRAQVQKHCSLHICTWGEQRWGKLLLLVANYNVSCSVRYAYARTCCCLLLRACKIHCAILKCYLSLKQTRTRQYFYTTTQFSGTRAKETHTRTVPNNFT